VVTRTSSSPLTVDRLRPFARRRSRRGTDVEGGLLTEEMLVVGVERDGDVLTPRGGTVVQQGGVVSLFSETGPERTSLGAFGT
jgi:hypothetical protein